MSNRRMFNKQILYRFDFVNMSAAAQRLYIYLILEADDDGFVSDPLRIVRMISVGEQDYEELKSCGFVHEFKSGICVIMHWLYHNSIWRDGYTATMFREERAQVKICGNEYLPLD